MTKVEKELLLTMHEQLNKLIGSIKGNGIRGLAKDVEDHGIKIDDMEKVLEHAQTHAGCAENISRCLEQRKEQIKSAVREAIMEKGRTKIMVVKDIVLGVLGLLGSAGTASVIIYLLTHAHPIVEQIK